MDPQTLGALAVGAGLMLIVCFLVALIWFTPLAALPDQWRAAELAAMNGQDREPVKFNRIKELKPGETVSILVAPGGGGGPGGALEQAKRPDGIIVAPKEHAELWEAVNEANDRIAALERLVQGSGGLAALWGETGRHEAILTKAAQFSADIEARYGAHNARLAELERLGAEHNQTIIHHRAVLRDLNQAAVDKIVDDVVMHRRRPITKRKR